jgi:hypothetical protein
LPLPPDRVSSPGDGNGASTAPIYVGGLDRCGKTTMSAYLTSHSRIAIPAVGSNMWTYFYGQFGDLADPANFERCLTALLSYKHVKFLKPDPERIRSEFWQGAPSYARLFDLFLIHFAEREGKPRRGAQTGLIERYVDQLIEAYDGVKIVHMLRDPRDRYLASIELWPDGRGRAGGATARWQYSTRLAERHMHRYPDQFLIVRFEDLINSTAPTLTAVCAFLGEDFEPAMLGMPEAPRHRDRLTGGAASPTPVDVLSPEHIGRFRGRVPPAEIAFIQQQAGRRMTRYGYALDPVELSASERTRFWLVDWPSQMGRRLAWRGVEEVQQRFPGQVGRKPGRRMIVEPG